ncbi:MAG: hypothetical protein JNL69_06150 [Bacteroidia bacterium]|nr:hypothetical protein [Bacteroidia bacterium]
MIFAIAGVITNNLSFALLVITPTVALSEKYDAEKHFAIAGVITCNLSFTLLVITPTVGYFSPLQVLSPAKKNRLVGDSTNISILITKLSRNSFFA